MEERRRTDAVATATAIESVRGDIKAISVELKSLMHIVNNQVASLQTELKNDRHTFKDIEIDLTEKIAELRANVLLTIHEHKSDTVPHPDTIGARVNSLESSRTYMKGVIAVGALIMPAVTGLVFKWLGVVIS